MKLILCFFFSKSFNLKSLTIFNSVPPEQKTPNNAPPVYREETGLHIGHRPKVSSSNQAIMENRLLKRPDEVLQTNYTAAT